MFGCGVAEARASARHAGRRLTPVSFAVARPVQWVVSPGGSASVRATIRSATSGPNRLTREDRVLSRSRPSTPS